MSGGLWFLLYLLIAAMVFGALSIVANEAVDENINGAAWCALFWPVFLAAALGALIAVTAMKAFHVGAAGGE